MGADPEWSSHERVSSAFSSAIVFEGCTGGCWASGGWLGHVHLGFAEVLGAVVGESPFAGFLVDDEGPLGRTEMSTKRV